MMRHLSVLCSRACRVCRSMLLIGAPLCLTAAARAADPVDTVPVDPLAAMDFGKPAKVASMRRDPELAATVVTFTTGTRLIVRQTKSEPGQVSVTVWLGNGRAGVPERLVHALWASVLLPLGGAGKLAYGDLDQWQRQSGVPVNVTFVPGVSAFQWKGTVPSAALAPEMRLLAAYARAPAFDPALAEKVASVGPMIASEIDGSPASTFQRGAQHVLAGSSRYQELPEKADIVATAGDDLSALLKPSLGLAADVAIVGDISVADAIQMTAATFAAGGPRPRVRHVDAVASPPRAGVASFVFAHAGDLKDAWLGEYWSLPDLAETPRVVRTSEIAAAVIEARLVKAMPPGWPGASAPVVRAGGSPEIKNGNAMGILVELHPNEIPAVKARIAATLRDMRVGKIGAEEMGQAREVVAARQRAKEASNEWWAERLVFGLRQPLLAWAIWEDRDRSPVSTGEVSSFIRRYLSPAPIIFEASGVILSGPAER